MNRRPTRRSTTLEPGIEVHVCHSLSRQLEVLHDRLLGWFDEIEGLEPSDVLVAFPDLAAAGPLIDGVFGTAPAGVAGERRRIPYRITGLPPSQANPVARVLLDWLALARAQRRRTGVDRVAAGGCDRGALRHRRRRARNRAGVARGGGRAARPDAAGEVSAEHVPRRAPHVLRRAHAALSRLCVA